MKQPKRGEMGLNTLTAPVPKITGLTSQQGPTESISCVKESGQVVKLMQISKKKKRNAWLCHSVWLVLMLMMLMLMIVMMNDE